MSLENLYDDCTENCERQPRCTVCHKTKNPRGRSAPLEMANSLCDWDCSGYTQEPTPGHLWPGELGRIRETEHATDDTD